MTSILEKCQKQKTISTHLVAKEIKQLLDRYHHLEAKHKELQHYSNKHNQMMQSEIKKLKAANKKLREQA